MKLIEAKCLFCGGEETLEIEPKDYYAWNAGLSYAQDAFQYLTPDQRELLISGTCGPCWDIEIPDDEEIV